MSQKFLSDVTLSTVTGGSMLKLDANGKIVAAVDGTDYISTSASSLWSTASGGIFYSDDVRIGTYQSDVAPDAKLHVYDYQTTTPKLLIEDGNTGDASMEFKISTQSFTMGIDNSDSDKFVIAASGGLGTSNVLEIATSGLSAFQNSVLVKGSLFINNQEQIQQGATEKIASFQNLGTERGYFEVTDIGKGYFYADGFKTGATTVGFLKSDGSVDTSSYATSADINSFIEIGDVATYLSTNSYLTQSAGDSRYATAAQGALADSALQSLPTHYHDGRYYTKTQSDNKYAVNGNNLVPINADGFYQLFTEEVILGSANEYRGLAFPNGGRNFVFEVSIKGNSLANHQGIFWGLNALESIYGNGEAGYKLTHQNADAFHIRDIATNTNQATSTDVKYAPNDGLYHRYKIISYVDPSNANKALFKVWVDGTLIFNAPQFAAPPQVPTYFGFINYTGDVTFSNWNVREITGEDELALLYGDGVFQPAGNYLTSLPAHHHDARYYTETEMDGFLAGKLSTSGGTISKTTNTAGTDGTTFLEIANNVGGDISQQQSFIDFKFTDTNANWTPQVRIGAQVGRDADANAISKEGAGAFVVYTGNGTDESGGGSLTEAMRVSYNGKLTVGGDIYSGSSKIATETFATGEAQSVQDNLDTLVGSLGSNAYTSYTDHTGLYDTIGSAAAEAGAVQDNLDGLVGSLGNAAFTSASDYATASHNHDDRYYTESESDTRFLNTSGDTATGLMTFSGGIDYEYAFYQGYAWYKRFYVRSVGLSGSAIANSWVLLGVVRNQSTYERTDIKFRIRGYDDVSSGTEIIQLRVENNNSAQEIHQLYWYADDATPNLFREVKSVIAEANGLNNTYLLWVKMLGDWTDTFTVEAEVFNSHSRPFEFDDVTVLPEGEIPEVPVSDITKTERVWYTSNASIHTTGGKLATESFVTGQGYLTSVPSSYATTSYVDTAVSNLVDSAPSALNTLNELAAALGDDANFSTTVTNSIGAKVSKAGDTMTGDLLVQSDIRSTSQIRATGWWNSPTGTTGNDAAFEIGVSGGEAYALAYDRTQQVYKNMNFAAVNFNFDERGGTTTIEGNEIWHAGNDGSGSGLDADLLDGMNPSTSATANTIMQRDSNGDTSLRILNVTNEIRVPSGGGVTDPTITCTTDGDTGLNFSGSGDMSFTSNGTKQFDFSDITTAIGWGNHADAGYLTSVPATFSATQITLGSGVVLRESSDRADLLSISSSTSSWGGLQVTNSSNEALGSFMVNDSSLGLYDDQQNEWIMLYSENAGTQHFYNGSAKMVINSAGAKILNTLELGNYSDTNQGVLALNGSTADRQSIIKTTNGNLHIDSHDGYSIYLNYYTGTADNIIFGNGNGGTSGAKVTSGGVIYATGGNSGEWNTAYSWGNHASAGYLTSIPSDYVRQGQDIVSGNIHPVGDRQQLLGLDSNRWQIVFCEILDSAGQHEKNLQNPEGEKSVGEYETGTVLVWKGGKNVPCTTAADHMRMGIAVKGIDSPLIQGAEPVLVTGAVNEGDYLVTSTKEGHAEAISPEFMRQHGLYDCVLGKALESAEGESHLVKTWINI